MMGEYFRLLLELLNQKQMTQPPNQDNNIQEELTWLSQSHLKATLWAANTNLKIFEIDMLNKKKF